jgi:hypothetical protein
MRDGIVSFLLVGPPHRCLFDFCTESKQSNLAISPSRSPNKFRAAALGTSVVADDDVKLLFENDDIIPPLGVVDDSAAELLFSIAGCVGGPPGGKGRVVLGKLVLCLLLLLLLLAFRFLDFFCFSAVLAAAAEDEDDA